jgi:signal transduction histidine kinase
MPGAFLTICRRWQQRGRSVSPPRARRLPLRLLSVAVLVVLAGVVAAAALTTRNVVRDQERLILRERTGEVADVLVSAFSGVQSSLQLLGVIAGSHQGDSQLFADATHSVTSSATQSWLVITARQAGLTVTAAAGTGPAVGQTISGERGALARLALSRKGLVSGLLRDGSRERLVFALGHAAGPGTVVWQESAISPATPIPSTSASPWSSLDIALYLSDRPDPAALVLSTTKNLPPGGLGYPIQVGTNTWLVVASPTRPLAGSLAQDMPWIVLAVGGLAALLMTTVTETLGRKRDYAAAQVQERTASLRNAMAELENTQAHLVRQEKLAAVGQLASTIGHELRNPLGVIMNVLYLMESAMGGDPNDPVHRHFATAKREVSAATLIVSDLLDFAAGRAPLLAPVDVADLLAEALSVAPPPDGVRVIQGGEPDTVITADRDQIRQALLNLITNAYDSMPGGGVLTVSAAREQGSVHITVADTGIGMNSETRDSIFTPFFTDKPRGIGLGLAVTKRVIDAHGGTITVDSTPSVGTSFTLTVPGQAATVGASR